MGQVVPKILLTKGLRAEFMKAWDNGESPMDVAPLIMKTSSSANEEEYGWLGQVPQLNEWKDERKLKGLIEFDYKIPNKHYESTLQVDRNSLDDDQIGAIRIRIADLARKARSHVLKLFYDALIAGDVDLGYDGQAFFSASHEEGNSGVQSNIQTGTGITTAQFIVDFEGARAKMRQIKDDQGEPYNEGELSLYVVAPTALEGVVDRVLSADLINNDTNTLKGAAKKLISSRLDVDDANDWYLMDSSGVMKPMIEQTRQSPMFESLESDSDRGFMSRRYLYGIDYRVGFGYGLWQKAVKVTNA